MKTQGKTASVDHYVLIGRRTELNGHHRDTWSRQRDGRNAGAEHGHPAVRVWLASGREDEIGWRRDRRGTRSRTAGLRIHLRLRPRSGSWDSSDGKDYAWSMPGTERGRLTAGLGGSSTREPFR